ncbi:MAG: SAM-dependent methlyltransferase [Roseovarius sp. BRH_c41]|uniref:magnesium protoporphyrin IX methyltransferase n=1 Tax=Roseovarius sp. BRH_c41 TaxID=1629709 RepID=UPI0005F23CE4|nr:magnesium protoporphyrin IX methyltransferase [Roseovarius sp. BRH_c41]KJS41744.1 MAG: SAM-dependent methlyltransferase [Roseovarius sp. BRH_c41]
MRDFSSPPVLGAPQDGWAQTRDRVETYFDRTATQVWERLTSDAPVSKIRQTVRIGRDAMRAQMLARLPQDMRGLRVLDAGCGAGQMTAELAARGAEVMAVDISPALIDLARRRLPESLVPHVSFHAGDMLDPALGMFDHVMAMDSLIYYTEADLARALDALAARTESTVIFTVAPRTPLLMAMWRMGKLFPRADRSPSMVPQSSARLLRALRYAGSTCSLKPLERVTSGFYISQGMEVLG